MPLDLREMSLGHRIVLTFIIVLVILFALALFGYYFTEGWDGEVYGLASESSRPAQLTQVQTQQGDLYGSTPLDATLLRMERRALEEAYHQQMLKLFGVWVSSGAPEEAKNFRNGLFIARRAYGLAAQSIAKREAELLEQERQRHDQQPDNK
jgi:hypothetical protein